MSVRAPAHGVIVLEGHCPSEEAEVLLRHLLAAPAAVVDLRACDSVHTAVVQVIIAAEVKICPPAPGSVLRTSLSSLSTRFVTC